MPLRYEIREDVRLVLTTGSGTLTDEDVLSHKQALIRDPLFRPGMREISDVRAVTALDVTPDGIRTFTSFDRTASSDLDGHKLAIVASTDLVFGTARMYGLQGPKEESVAVFRCVEEARRWLGLSGTTEPSDSESESG